MDNKEFEGTRNLLRKSSTTPTPVGMEARILLRIAEEADAKAKKRGALSSLLKWASIGLVVIAIGQAFLPGTGTRTVVAAASRVTEHPGENLAWLWQNLYLILPLLAVYLFGKIYKWRER